MGGIFANFRGMVVGSPHPDRNLRSIYPSPLKLPRFLQKYSAIQLPGWLRPGATQTVWMGARLTDKEARDRTRELWPLVTCERRVPLPSIEISVSIMLNRHALYITAVGAQPSPYLEKLLEQEKPPIPAYYLIYVTTFSQWQIGRLIDDLNHLATVRIAALQELQNLNRISDDLRSLSKPKDGAGIKKIQEEILNLDSRISGGVNYRIERSRYYVSQFMSGIKILSISNLDGYQPYDVFVLRRLGSTFDFIDRLGIRIERAKNDLSARAQTITANTSLKHLEELVDLQTLGESFFWLFLIPYYVNGNVEHIVGQNFFIKDKIEQFVCIGDLYCYVWGFFFLFGILRIIALRNKKRNIKK